MKVVIGILSIIVLLARLIPARHTLTLPLTGRWVLASSLRAARGENGIL